MTPLASLPTVVEKVAQPGLVPPKGLSWRVEVVTKELGLQLGHKLPLQPFEFLYCCGDSCATSCRCGGGRWRRHPCSASSRTATATTATATATATTAAAAVAAALSATAATATVQVDLGEGEVCRISG